MNDLTTIPWIALLITILGWWVVHVMANKRQSRQELRDYINKLENLIIDLQEISVAYWSTNGSNRVEEAKMIHLVTRITSAGYILGNNETKFSDIKNKTVLLKIHATGGEFETSNRQSSLIKIRDIRNSAKNCIESMETTFFKDYR